MGPYYYSRAGNSPYIIIVGVELTDSGEREEGTIGKRTNLLFISSFVSRTRVGKEFTIPS